MDIALIEPEIPGNTGSIGRICVGTATRLHLVGTLGFDISEAAVRRAGLDYWRDVDLQVHADVETFLAAVPERVLHFFSTHGGVRYDQVRYGADDILVFGRESRGLSPELHARFAAQLRYVPVKPAIRSLNLANCAAVVLFEALRQQGFGDVDPRR